MNNFYLFFIWPGLKEFLLEELKIKHPSLKLSYSNKDFISMKGDDIDKEKIENSFLIYSSRQAQFVEKKNTKPENTPYYEVNENEYWCYEILNKYHIDLLEFTQEPLPSDSPARAWLKMQEAHKIFNIKIQKEQQFIEIGSAPGGISHYLLNLGVNLLSIDPAEMSPSLYENFKNRFKHLKKSIFEIKKTDLPNKCDWIISDLNLDGDQNTSQIKRIASYYPEIRGGFLTIKTPKKIDVKRILDWEKLFTDKYKVRTFHLPSHKKEIGLIFLRH